MDLMAVIVSDIGDMPVLKLSIGVFCMGVT